MNTRHSNAKKHPGNVVKEADKDGVTADKAAVEQAKKDAYDKAEAHNTEECQLQESGDDAGEEMMDMECLSDTELHIDAKRTNGAAFESEADEDDGGSFDDESDSDNQVNTATQSKLNALEAEIKKLKKGAKGKGAKGKGARGKGARGKGARGKGTAKGNRGGSAASKSKKAKLDYDSEIKAARADIRSKAIGDIEEAHGEDDNRESEAKLDEPKEIFSGLRPDWQARTSKGNQRPGSRAAQKKNVRDDSGSNDQGGLHFGSFLDDDEDEMPADDKDDDEITFLKKSRGNALIKIKVEDAPKAVAQRDYISTFQDFAGSQEHPWVLDSETEAEEMRRIWDNFFPDKKSLSYGRTHQKLLDWRSAIGSHAVTVVNKFMTKDSGFKNAQSRAKYIRNQLGIDKKNGDEKPFVYKDGKVGGATFQSDFILATLAHHLKMTANSAGGYGPPIAALTLAVTAVHRALDSWKTSTQSKMDSFSQEMWGPILTAYLEFIAPMDQGYWSEILTYAHEMKRSSHESRSVTSPEKGGKRASIIMNRRSNP
ncbi:hypothetical protein BOTBODRAFT_49763 [Botryobasidium botryosum FD-172 SS1]|uniref:DUF6532 domain-containing protein n=1 Tax=Botryobasidium botryosum (strain FD-172 SS1) TaxID=930990 RepID=A0A067M235_BOTB1|nr:hypothetical protein BOTBODRAFT_49763 [Botryobasidium botryosum FD-172 SS1]